MVNKKYVPKRKYNLKNKNKKENDDFAEKITVQVYACVIICAIMMVLSMAKGDFGQILRQKIKVAIDDNISFDDVIDVFNDIEEKVKKEGANIIFSNEVFDIKDNENLNF